MPTLSVSITAPHAPATVVVVDPLPELYVCSGTPFELFCFCFIRAAIRSRDSASPGIKLMYICFRLAMMKIAHTTANPVVMPRAMATVVVFAINIAEIRKLDEWRSLLSEADVVDFEFVY